jgi:hypothetical protein
MKPSLIEFKVGQTIHNQPLRLACSVENGKQTWSLFKAQADQRDDNQAIHGIPGEVFVAMAEAVKSIEGR